MKRIYTLLPGGDNAKPILVVAVDMVSAFRAALAKLSEGTSIIAVQEGPEVEVFD